MNNLCTTLAFFVNIWHSPIDSANFGCILKLFQGKEKSFPRNLNLKFGSKKQPPRRLEDPRQAVMKWRNV